MPVSRLLFEKDPSSSLAMRCVFGARALHSIRKANKPSMGTIGMKALDVFVYGW